MDNPKLKLTIKDYIEKQKLVEKKIRLKKYLAKIYEGMINEIVDRYGNSIGARVGALGFLIAIVIWVLCK